MAVWTTPVDVVNTNTIVTADVNAQIIENLKYIKDNVPTVRLYHNTTQSMTGTADNKVLFNSERYDNAGLHSTVSNTSRISIPTPDTTFCAGIYHIWFNGEWATAPATCEVEVWLNGVTKIAWNTTTQKRFQIDTEYPLAAGDYVEFVLNPATTQTLNSTANYSPEGGATRISGGL
jgi:hypothetical protein